MKRYFLLLSILYSISLLQAQEKETDYKYWMTLGGMFVGENVSGNIGYCFSLGTNFYKVGYLIQDKFRSFGGGSVETADFNSIDISIGKSFQTEWWQVAFFVGSSYVFGAKSISNDFRENYDTIGLQTDIQLLFRYANELGIGLGLWGNINIKNSSAGVNINLTIGNGK